MDYGHTKSPTTGGALLFGASLVHQLTFLVICIAIVAVAVLLIRKLWRRRKNIGSK